MQWNTFTKVFGLIWMFVPRLVKTGQTLVLSFCCGHENGLRCWNGTQPGVGCNRRQLRTHLKRHRVVKSQTNPSKVLECELGLGVGWCFPVSNGNCNAMQWGNRRWFRTGHMWKHSVEARCWNASWLGVGWVDSRQLEPMRTHLKTQTQTNPTNVLETNLTKVLECELAGSWVVRLEAIGGGSCWQPASLSISNHCQALPVAHAPTVA